MMMKTSPNTLRIGIAVTIVLGTIAWLALSGMSASKYAPAQPDATPAQPFVSTHTAATHPAAADPIAAN